MDSSVEHLLVTQEEEKIRLDKLLSLRFPSFSRTYFQFLIETGAVLVNSKQLKKRTTLTAGDEIEICFLITPELKLEPENIPLNILFEDEHLLAIDKPAGMVVHPAPGHFTGTFVHALLFHCKNIQTSGAPSRPGIVHRLDKETTGVLLAAKTSAAHERLVSLFSERRIYKEYLAVSVGNPGARTINAPIGRHPIDRKKMAVSQDKGREAITHVRTLESKNGFSLLSVELITGRTHQIRVHLKEIGFPVLGDPVYGSSSVNLKQKVSRQLLHARRLKFLHPMTGKEIDLKADLPSDMLHFLRAQNFQIGCI